MVAVVRRKTDRGAAAVEFALILPLLMVIVLGTIDWGYFFFVEQLVTNASREGARTGSLTPYAAADASADAHAQADAETAARAYLSGAGLSATLAVVNASTVVDATGGASVQVTVTYPTGSITGFEVLDSLLPASATATSVFRR